MCTNCAVQLDQTLTNKFAERMMTVLNHGALGLMISLGHRTRLFDVMAELPPSTSHAIAAEANLYERYVREWLAVMVTGGVVEYDPKEKTYHLPAEHAAWLTRKNTPNNIAVTAQWLPLMAQVEDGIVECFYKGGGLGYDAYTRFNEVMAEESQQTVVTPLLEKLLPLMDGIKEKLEKGISVLDVGCGRGRALLQLAQAFPKSRFTGYDLMPEAVEYAKDEAVRLGLRNIVFAVKDASAISEQERYDLIFTFDAVHDQAKPAAVLKNIYTALKKGGTYFCQDIAGSSFVEKNKDHPLGPLMYAISCTSCMSVSLSMGGAGLGTMWGKELACQMFQEAGFPAVEVKNLEHDIINNYYIMTK